MFAVVNTMNKTDDSPGTIESQHRTLEAAVAGNRRLQVAVKRANGSTSYLPTVIVELKCKPRGKWLHDDEYRSVDVYDILRAEQAGLVS